MLTHTRDRYVELGRNLPLRHLIQEVHSHDLALAWGELIVDHLHHNRKRLIDPIQSILPRLDIFLRFVVQSTARRKSTQIFRIDTNLPEFRIVSCLPSQHLLRLIITLIQKILLSFHPKGGCWTYKKSAKVRRLLPDGSGFLREPLLLWPSKPVAKAICFGDSMSLLVLNYLINPTIATPGHSERSEESL